MVRPVAVEASSRLVSRFVSIGSGTAVSRITGLGRVLVIGYVFGAGPVSDAFTAANNAPNSLYELLLGGLLSAGLVPLFTHLDERDDREGIGAVVGVTAVALVVLTAAAVAAAPWVFRLVSLFPADEVDATQFRAAGTALSRLLLIQIGCYGAMALATALLHARNRFLVAAWAPAVANGVIITALLSLPNRPPGGWTLESVLDDRAFRLVLGGGATLGIATMALITSVAAARGGPPVRPRFRPRHPAVRRLVAVSGWTLGYVVANQIALITVQNLTEPGSGGRFAYSQAYTFFVLPHGLLAVTVATALGPTLARATARGDRPAVSRTMADGLEMLVLVTLPAGVGIFLVRDEIVGTFLRHGSFDAADAALTADTLGAFALGLAGFSTYLFALRGFYARLDTRTPFVINAGECALNIVLALALVGRFGVPGLAAAFSLAYAVAAIFAVARLRRDGLLDALGPFVALVARGAGAAAIMAVVVVLVDRALAGATGATAAVTLVVLVLTGLAAYLAALRVVARSDVARLRVRLGSSPEPPPG